MRVLSKVHETNEEHVFMKDYTIAITWSKISKERGLRKGRGESPEPMEPHCKIIMIIIIV